MKIKSLVLLFFGLCFVASCNQTVKKEKPKTVKKQNHVITEKLQTVSVIGDFDGDKQIDTLNQIYTSEDNPKPIHQVTFNNPKNIDYEYDKVNYYFKHRIQVDLKSNNPKINSLWLGICYGTFCLINVGDINHDGKDELAITIDYCDYSLPNSCNIYGYCNNEWKELHQFNINENAFTYGKSEVLDPNKIEKYLEKRNGKWYYLDYLEWFRDDSNEKTTPMRPLKVKKCN